LPRSLHCAFAKGATASVGMTGRGVESNGRSGPDLVFGASTGFIRWDGFGGKKERSAGDFLAVGKSVGDGFEISFDEAHGADFDGAAGVHEEDGGDVGEAVGVGGGIAFFVEEEGEGEAIFLGEGLGVAGVVLGDAEESDAVAAVALEEALEEGKRVLADGAGDFEKSNDGGAFFEGGFEREGLAVERFQGEVRGFTSCDDVGHRVIGSDPARELAKDGHTFILAQQKIGEQI